MTQMARLLHLSRLLEAAAEREVAKCSAALTQANAAIETARADATRLRTQVGEQKAQVRDLFLGASHARQGVEMLLSDLSGLDAAIEEADQRITAAEEVRNTAADALTKAQKAYRRTLAKVTRRSRLVSEHRQALARRAEAVAEAEALDQWTGLQSQWRAS